jgi:hypothetical protein
VTQARITEDAVFVTDTGPVEVKGYWTTIVVRSCSRGRYLEEAAGHVESNPSTGSNDGAVPNVQQTMKIPLVVVLVGLAISFADLCPTNGRSKNRTADSCVDNEV